MTLPWLEFKPLLDWLDMADSFFNLEDEPLPSFLSSSLDSTSGPVVPCGNVTLGSGPGFPVAASTVAKIRAGADIRYV